MDDRPFELNLVMPESMKDYISWILLEKSMMCLEGVKLKMFC